MKLNYLLSVLAFSWGSWCSAQCVQGDCQNGIGIYKYPSGARYEGQFNDNKINGIGILYLSNGDLFTGHWVNNYRQGKGKMSFHNGDQYSGEFSRSKIEGTGTMSFANGSRYSGEWKNNYPHGKGTYLYDHGEKYEGLFTEGLRQGFGKYFYNDGSSYDGQWSQNQREGSGLFTSHDGKKTNGVWQHDQLTNEISASNTNVINYPAASPTTVISNPNALINCNDNNCDGISGYYIFKDGSKYTGPFKNGNPYGQGILFYANGDRYEGEWDDVAPDGRGIMYFASGRVYAAIWDKGKPVKQLDQRIEIPKRNDIKVQSDDEIRIWPVIIGVARYEHMPALKYSDDDAYKIYAFMKSPEGGAIPDNQIKLLIDEDATRVNIIDALQEQFGKADENDMVMVYYSGHGVSGSLLPIDFDGYNNKLYHDEIVQIMESSKAKHKLCLIDACYAGGMNDAKADYTTSINRFYNQLNQEKGGTAMILSCKSREVSLEDSGLRQGIFSHFLIRGLKGEADENRNKIVSVQELFNFINTRVRSYTLNTQNPEIDGQYNPSMPVAWIRN
ncbi:MAG: caspase family protein [Saprospiraceae bacterium]